MSFLPKLIAFLIIAILLVIIVGFVISRFFVKKEIKRSQSLSTLLPESLSRPARLHLERSRAFNASEKMMALWREFDQLGFMMLADYSERNNVIANIRLAGHPALKIGGILVEEKDGSVYGVVIAVTSSNHVEARGNGREVDLSIGTTHWVMHPGYSAKACFDGVRKAVTGETLMNPDTRLLRMIWESIFAQNADAEIVSGMLTRDKIIRHLDSLSIKPDKELVDQLMETSSTLWRTRMNEAALDHWRLDNNIDDDNWQTIKQHAHVVDNFLEVANLKNMFSDFDGVNSLIQQIGKTELSGVQLYEKVQRLLPENQRYKLAGEVHRPIYALIYVPEHVTYEEDTDAIPATIPLSQPAEHHISDKAQKEEIGNDILEMTKNALSQTGGRIVWKNIWVWLLPLGLLLLSFTADLSSWLNVLIYGFALLAFVFLIFSVIPAFLYRQVLFAHAYRQPKTGLILLNMLRHLDLLRSIDRDFLAAERSKFYAMQDDIDSAVELWNDYRENVNDDTYYIQLAQIYDAAGLFDEQIESLRKLHEIDSDNDGVAIDLVVALLHYRKDAVSAEKILKDIDETSLSEVARIDYYFAQGLVRALYKDFFNALVHYQRALNEANAIIKENPLIITLIIQISGYAAISLLFSGARDSASKIMKLLVGSLRQHPSTRIIVKRFSSAWQKRT